MTFAAKARRLVMCDGCRSTKPLTGLINQAAKQLNLLARFDLGPQQAAEIAGQAVG